MSRSHFDCRAVGVSGEFAEHKGGSWLSALSKDGGFSPRLSLVLFHNQPSQNDTQRRRTVSGSGRANGADP
jgi:hypothetical protein